ncbi:MAG: NAD(P)H-dependent oxidoreductase subunit E [Chloroflexi bacterium]|nr:NAD(P)H-dependent oxidoreductase subunit E [Chloroflexota bacterium]
MKTEVQKNGYISSEIMSGVAKQAGLQVNEVYGVATFYSYLPVAPTGKNVIKVCKCVPCSLKDVPEVVAGIRKAIGVAPGQTTADGKFSLEMVNCIGACDQAPAMMINDTLYGNLTPAKIADILSTY